MTRLIDADTLIERLKFKRRLNGNIPDKCAGYDSAIAQANKLPSVDPVHAAGVCYCRECTCWNRHDDILPDGRFPDWGYCSKMLDSDSEIEITTLENDFCSWGQRREDTK